MKLIDYFNAGVAEALGYRPVTTSIKPVHIANGLCRAALGEYYNPKVLNRALNRWVKQEERHPSDELVQSAGGALGDFTRAEHRPKLDEFRHLLKGVLGADRGVYDGNQYSSYTLTYRAHITSDRNDWGTGDFLYHLLNTDLGAGPSPTIELIRELLRDASDEITAMSWPLIKDEQPSIYEVRADEAPQSLAVTKRDGRLEFASQTVQGIREGFDTLARFELERGNKLHSLKRLVCFSTFSLFLHLTHRALDYEAADEMARRRPPMLLDLTQRGWTPVGRASHATYNLACKSVERLVWHGMREALSQERKGRWTAEAVREFIRDVEFKGTERQRVQLRRHFLDVFESYAGGEDAQEALYRAAVDALFEGMSGTPISFTRRLGITVGLLAPRGNRATRKRYTPSPDLVEVLLAATVRVDEAVELSELADRWWRSFGIIVGCRGDDPQELRDRQISDASRGDLVENADALREALIGIGCARRYADGVTVVRSAWEGQ